ncbi:MAG: M24 family metallopeptidase, partial [bacterium]
MINIKTPQQIDDAAESSAIVAEVLQKLKESIKPGINTAELDSIAKQTAKSRNGRCAFLGYRDFPGAICASVNNEVVHGIPSENRVLKQGDIISIDFGIEKNGFFGDAAITVPV